MRRKSTKMVKLQVWVAAMVTDQMEQSSVPITNSGKWGAWSRKEDKQTQVRGSMLHYIITPSYVWGQAIHIDALAERDYGRAQLFIAAR